ncbi:hypothetical protein HanIR_Chr01g0001011 [Helianthus annuus]|nr:hypothetical protein HanIR_Chr01g0001011 [Helianthus annuus]
MLEQPQQAVVRYTKASPLSAYTGVVPKIAQMCPKGNRKEKMNLEEKSQEMWKRVFFNKEKSWNSKILHWFFN